jgi:hypothetical protein
MQLTGQSLSGKGEIPMSTDKSATTSPRKENSLSLDGWALIVATLLALAVKFDILKNVPW